MADESRSVREDLYRVIHHYAELAAMARQGEVDPVGQIGRILKKESPYLLLQIRKLLPALERDQLTYYEVLYNLIREGQEFPDYETILDSRQEIDKIESETRVFIYAVKWIDSKHLSRPSSAEREAMLGKLREFNRKYRKRYAPDADDTTTLIPCQVLEQSPSEEATHKNVIDVVKRAVLELFHLMMNHEPSRAFLLFTRDSRREIEADLMKLAWFVLRSGYTVDRIAGGYYKEILSEFLNEKLLDHLIETADTVRSLQGVANHLAVISLLDFANFFEIPSDYVGLEDLREAGRHAKVIKGKKRRGADLLRKMVELHQLYEQIPQGLLAQRFLGYRYYSSFGSYHGERRPYDMRAKQAVDLYKSIVDPEAIKKRTQEDLKESSELFSSKTMDQMGDIIRLLQESLSDPRKVRGRQVKVLGEISSGAMGQVSIGIHKDRIVALKTVKAQVSQAMGDAVALLEYEAAINARVQTPEQHPRVVEYYGMIEQDGEKILINGYYPNDSLTTLVEKNWTRKHKPPFAIMSSITLGTVEVVAKHLVDCLRHLKSKGVVHRDLKTDNILYMVDARERVNSIKIIDFGVGLGVGPGATEDIFAGKVVGTFSYMAPEQARGKSCFESDLYSTGAILCVMLTGKLPLVFPKTRTRKELAEQIRRIEKAPRPVLTKLNPWLKKHTAMENIAAIVQTMLELNAERRPSLDEVEAALDGEFSHLGDDKYSLSVFYQDS